MAADNQNYIRESSTRQSLSKAVVHLLKKKPRDVNRELMHFFASQCNCEIPVAESVKMQTREGEVEECKKLWAETRGWVVTTGGKLLMRQASKKYGKPLYVEEGGIAPFNECQAWYSADGEDHWFEIPLSSTEVREERGRSATMDAMCDNMGRLFTTRMPREICAGIGEEGVKAGRKWRIDDGDSEASQDKMPKGGTRVKLFREKVKRMNLNKVFCLVEHHEPSKAHSDHLLEFYKDLGLEVALMPIEDYNTPNRTNYEQCFKDLTADLVAGKNCLVHCWGGSGRTGTVVVGALLNLGIDNPVRYARRFKSVYLDTAEQEFFVETQQFVVSERAFAQFPELAKVATADKICDLTEAVATGGKLVPSEGDPYSEDELKALRKVFEMFDVDGSGNLSLPEVTAFTEGLFKANGKKQDNLKAHLVELFTTLDPSFPNHLKVSFDLFVKTLTTSIQLDGKDKVAKTHAEIHAH